MSAKIHIGITGPTFGSRFMFEQYYRAEINKYAALPNTVFHVLLRDGIGFQAFMYFEDSLETQERVLYCNVADDVRPREKPHSRWLILETPAMAYAQWLAASTHHVIQTWPLIMPFAEQFDFARASAARTTALPYVSSLAASQCLGALEATTVVLPADVARRIGDIIETSLRAAVRKRELEQWGPDESPDALNDDPFPSSQKRARVAAVAADDAGASDKPVSVHSSAVESIESKDNSVAVEPLPEEPYAIDVAVNSRASEEDEEASDALADFIDAAGTPSVQSENDDDEEDSAYEEEEEDEESLNLDDNNDDEEQDSSSVAESDSDATAPKKVGKAKPNSELIESVRTRQSNARKTSRSTIPFVEDWQVLRATSKPDSKLKPKTKPAADFAAFCECMRRPRSEWSSTEFFRKYAGILYNLFKTIGNDYRQVFVRELFLLAASNRLAVTPALVDSARLKCCVCLKSGDVLGAFKVAAWLSGEKPDSYPMARTLTEDSRCGSVCGRRLVTLCRTFAALNAAKAQWESYKTDRERGLALAHFLNELGFAQVAADQEQDRPKWRRRS